MGQKKQITDPVPLVMHDDAKGADLTRFTRMTWEDGGQWHVGGTARYL